MCWGEVTSYKGSQHRMTFICRQWRITWVSQVSQMIWVVHPSVVPRGCTIYRIAATSELQWDLKFTVHRFSHQAQTSSIQIHIMTYTKLSTTFPSNPKQLHRQGLFYKSQWEILNSFLNDLVNILKSNNSIHLELSFIFRLFTHIEFFHEATLVNGVTADFHP